MPNARTQNIFAFIKSNPDEKTTMCVCIETHVKSVICYTRRDVYLVTNMHGFFSLKTSLFVIIVYGSEQFISLSLFAVLLFVVFNCIWSHFAFHRRISIDRTTNLTTSIVNGTHDPFHSLLFIMWTFAFKLIPRVFVWFLALRTKGTGEQALSNNKANRTIRYGD